MMSKTRVFFVNADDAASESESNPEDNEPLVKLVTSKAPVHKAAKNEYVWKNCDFSAPDVTFSGAKPQVPDEIASPLHCFRQYISDKMLTALVENTNFYSVGIPAKQILKRRHYQAVVGSGLILISAEHGRKCGRPSTEEKMAVKSVDAMKKVRKEHHRKSRWMQWATGL